VNNKIIAEIGSVHDGSFGNAKCLISSAIRSGADIVKFQLHIFDEESLSSAPNPKYFNDESRKDYFKRTSFSKKQWMELKKYTEELGAQFLVSPFSIAAVDFLESIDVSFYKVPSGEVNNLPLLERLAITKKTILLSSGMSSWAELDKAVKLLIKGNNLILMQCSSLYPCPPESVGLNVITEMQARYDCSIGFSDHTLGHSASIAAAVLGATVIEKHVTFSKSMYGSDAAHSMEMDEFNSFCNNVKETWNMLANRVNKSDISQYLETKKIFEKSIVSSMPIDKESLIDLEMLSYKKPGDGILACDYHKIIGKKLKISVDKDYKFDWKDFE
jgi:N,N'-diacetyllegionaminate synthase